MSARSSAFALVLVLLTSGAVGIGGEAGVLTTFVADIVAFRVIDDDDDDDAWGSRNTRLGGSAAILSFFPLVVPSFNSFASRGRPLYHHVV